MLEEMAASHPSERYCQPTEALAPAEWMVAMVAQVVELIPIPKPVITMKQEMVVTAVMAANSEVAEVPMVLLVYMYHLLMVVAARAVMAANGVVAADPATQAAILPLNNIVLRPGLVDNMVVTAAKVVVAQPVLLLRYPPQKDPLELTPSV